MQRCVSNSCTQRSCTLIVTPIKSLVPAARKSTPSRCTSRDHQSPKSEDIHNRRGVLSIPLLALTLLQLAPFPVRAEEEVVESPALVVPSEQELTSEPEITSQSSISSSSSAPIKAQQVYFDIKINDVPAGRVVIELFSDVAPSGVLRFRQLAEGRQGVGYRLSKFLGIYPTFIESDGVNRLSYAAGAESPLEGGDSLQQLEEELASQTRKHDAAGIVSLIIGEAEERKITEKLVAVDGELITVKAIFNDNAYTSQKIKSQAGAAPNGTGFTITTAASPALDATHLQIGRVVSGMELVERISGLPIVKPREDLLMKSYFEFGKAMGDKRAVTAEAGFYRPFKPVRVYACGTL